QEAISAFESLSRTYTDKAGRPTHADSYFGLSGLSPQIAAPGDDLALALGTLNTHYYRESYAYDDRGRLYIVTDWSGTVYRTDFDALGRPVSDWIGADGIGSHIVTDCEWDFGGTGDSNLTAVI